MAPEVPPWPVDDADKGRDFQNYMLRCGSAEEQPNDPESVLNVDDVMYVQSTSIKYIVSCLCAYIYMYMYIRYVDVGIDADEDIDVY